MIMSKKLSTISYIMLLSTFICNLFYSTTYPYIYSVVIKSVTNTYISIDQILYCIGIILMGIYGIIMVAEFLNTIK